MVATMGIVDRMKARAEDLSKKARPAAEELRERAKPLAERLKQQADQLSDTVKKSAENFSEGLHPDQPDGQVTPADQPAVPRSGETGGQHADSPRDEPPPASPAS